ncbi:hypothetical protein [Actinokineospora sp.]|uniref:hypothetical protein n=1 Tax=Actinokineospora sp. TaxID=1872133 RepID=UPI004037CC9C
MPDNTPPLTPAQQQAQDKMRHWMEAHDHTPTIPGPFGNFSAIGTTVHNLLAAAAAGQLAIAPDTADAINKQLTAVQDSAELMVQRARRVSRRAPLGGGYAEEISSFNMQLAAGGTNSAEQVLTKFSKDIEVLKQAVAASMANYTDTDTGNAGNIRSAGGDA